MSSRRVTVTGATGLIGPRLVGELQRQGWEVSVLSRDPDRARERLGGEIQAFAETLHGVRTVFDKFEQALAET